MLHNADLNLPFYILGTGVVAHEYQQWITNEGIDQVYLVEPVDFVKLAAGSQCLFGFHNIEFKRKWIETLANQNLKWPTYIHPSAIVSSPRLVGYGSCIGVNAYLGYAAGVGNFSTVCETVVIGHNTKIGNNAFVGAGTTMGGSSQIGNNVYFGIRNAVKDKITIVDNCYFAIGTTIRKTVRSPGRYYNHGNVLHTF